MCCSPWGLKELDTTEQDEVVGSPCSPRDSQESSLTPQFKSINSALSFLFALRYSGRSFSNMNGNKTYLKL